MLATPATHVGLVRAGLPAITESNQAVDFLDDSPLELYQDRIGVLDHAGTEHAGQRGPGAIITIKPMLTNCDNAGSNLQRKRKKMSHRFLFSLLVVVVLVVGLEMQLAAEQAVCCSILHML